MRVRKLHFRPVFQLFDHAIHPLCSSVSPVGADQDFLGLTLDLALRVLIHFDAAT